MALVAADNTIRASVLLSEEGLTVDLVQWLGESTRYFCRRIRSIRLRSAPTACDATAGTVAAMM